MAGARRFAGLSEEEILAQAEQRAELIRQYEAELMALAYEFSVVHNADTLDPGESSKPGRERAKQLGGEGTAAVSEFAAATFGARIGRSPFAAAAMIGDAQDIRHRLPAVQARIDAGEVRVSYARHVAKQTRDLTQAEALHVDKGVAESADGRISWSRFEALVEAKVAQAAPDRARELEEQRARATFVKKVRAEGHGMGTLMVRADIATIDEIDAAVTVKADQLVEVLPDADVDTRRVRAMLLLANPGKSHDTHVRDLSPTVQLYLHHYVGPDAEGIARLEGHGPVTEAWISRVLGPRCRFKVTPVLDLAGQAPVDAYEIPDRHREAVRLMTPADTFPFASSLSRDQEIDHTIPFDEGGESAIGNYGPMTRRHHRIKTHAGWAVQQPFPGIYIWRDPLGGFYLVDHTGTRRLRRAA